MTAWGGSPGRVVSLDALPSWREVERRALIPRSEGPAVCGYAADVAGWCSAVLASLLTPLADQLDRQPAAALALGGAARLAGSVAADWLEVTVPSWPARHLPPLAAITPAAVRTLRRTDPPAAQHAPHLAPAKRRALDRLVLGTPSVPGLILVAVGDPRGADDAVRRAAGRWVACLAILAGLAEPAGQRAAGRSAWSVDQSLAASARWRRSAIAVPPAPRPAALAA